MGTYMDAFISDMLYKCLFSGFVNKLNLFCQMGKLVCPASLLLIRQCRFSTNNNPFFLLMNAYISECCMYN
uniref:Uncharacterized protein n=1 Tax=Anguilla anguilla TaxID=7936 RepID=A0A0E9WW85_ANGAN